MRTSTWLLFIAVLATGLYIGLLDRKKDSTDRKRAIARRVLRIDPTRINSLRVLQPDLQFAAEKRGDQWQLTSPMSARADNGVIARLIDTIELLERSDVIRGREQRRQGLTLADFGLDDPRTRIVLGSAEKEWTLLVGRDTPVGGQLFLKEARDSSVFVAPTNLLADLPASIDALRDRRLFIGLPGDVNRLDLRRPEGLLNLARVDVGNWRIQQPWSGRAASGPVRDILDQLFTARVVDFVAESFDAAPLYGLDEPTAQAIVTGDRRMGEQVLLLGKPVDRNTNLVYATMQGKSAVYTVNRTLLDALQVKAETLRDRRLLTLPVFDIASIRIEEGERSILLNRSADGSGWELLAPVQQKANEQLIQSALAEWSGARIESFLDRTGTNALPPGMETPVGRITFSRRPLATTTNGAASAANPDEEAVLLIFEQGERANRTLVKWAHEELPVTIARAVLDALPASPLYYRSPEVLTLDPDAVRSLSRSVDGREESVIRDGTNQYRAAAGSAVVDMEHVQRTLDTLAVLRAKTHVAAAADNLPAYGLAEPRAQLLVGIQGGAAPTRTLWIGGEDPDGNAYAMIRGGDVVFTLDPSVRDILLAPLYKSAEPAKENPVVPSSPEPIEP